MADRHYTMTLSATIQCVVEAAPLTPCILSPISPLMCTSPSIPLSPKLAFCHYYVLVLRVLLAPIDIDVT